MTTVYIGEPAFSNYNTIAVAELKRVPVRKLTENRKRLSQVGGKMNELGRLYIGPLTDQPNHKQAQWHLHIRRAVTQIVNFRGLTLLYELSIYVVWPKTMFLCPVNFVIFC